VSYETRAPTLPLPLARDGGLVWHYTSAAGVIGIAQSGCLWASSPRALNDSTEASYGWRVIQRTWRRFDKSQLDPESVRLLDEVMSINIAESLQETTYVVSASRKGDLLNQWRFYGNTDGFSLGLNLEYFWAPLYRLTQIVHEDPADPTRPKVDRKLRVWEGWYDVIYRREDQIRAATNALRWLLERWRDFAFPDELRVFSSDPFEFPRFVLRSLVLQMKHPGFRDERETRFIAGRAVAEPPLFREIKGRVIPYLPVSSIPRIMSRGDERAIALPLDTVCCGPGVTEASALVMKSMFGEIAPGVKIRRSKIPFAGA
jgi:hypothetical protein